MRSNLTEIHRHFPREIIYYPKRQSARRKYQCGRGKQRVRHVGAGSRGAKNYAQKRNEGMMMHC
jgi:hypothetical protein